MPSRFVAIVEGPSLSLDGMAALDVPQLQHDPREDLMVGIKFSCPGHDDNHSRHTQ